MWGCLFVVAAVCTGVGMGAGAYINNAKVNKEMFKNNRII